MTPAPPAIQLQVVGVNCDHACSIRVFGDRGPVTERSERMLEELYQRLLFARAAAKAQHLWQTYEILNKAIDELNAERGAGQGTIVKVRSRSEM